MRDRNLIIGVFESLCAQGGAAALATVVWVEGSSYRHPGARMLIAADGRTWGTVSGGCLELDVARRGRMLILEPAKPVVVSYETDDDNIGEESAQPIVDPGPSLGCGGRIEILIQRVAADDPGPLAALATVVRERKHAAVATVIRIGSAVNASVFPGAILSRVANGEIEGRFADAALHQSVSKQLIQLEDATARPYSLSRHSLSTGGWADVLIEYLSPAQTLAIFGDGHDVAPLVDLARALAWHVTVIGRRPLAAMRQSFPTADELICASDSPAQAAADVPTDTAVVIMGHNLRRDGAALAALLQTPRSYVGVLGPRRRTARLLSAAGFAPDDQRIHSPIGLDIGAETAEQIALSIIAEIQSVAADRPAGFLRNRPGPIHLDRQEVVNDRYQSDSHR